MLVLIVALLFGLGIAYFALQNTAQVTVSLLHSSVQGVPLYLVIIGSLFVGVAISWILHVLDGVSTAIMVHRKNRQLQKTDTSLNALEKRIHDLEVENARLKGKAVDETFRTENPPVQEPKPSFFDRFRHNLRIG